jgi:hypothetical protein
MHERPSTFLPSGLALQHTCIFRAQSLARFMHSFSHQFRARELPRPARQSVGRRNLAISGLRTVNFEEHAMHTHPK